MSEAQTTAAVPEATALSGAQIAAIAADLNKLKTFADANPPLAAAIRDMFGPQITPPPPKPEDLAVAGSDSLNGFVASLRAVNPGLATQIEGKSLLGSKTIYIQLATPVVSFIAGQALAKYGLALDDDSAKTLAGLLALGMSAIAGIIVRLFTRAPITSLLPKNPAVPPDVSTASASTPPS